jgi:hypothetical protein
VAVYIRIFVIDDCKKQRSIDEAGKNKKTEEDGYFLPFF